jgi:hypothetical protein
VSAASATEEKSAGNPPSATAVLRVAGKDFDVDAVVTFLNGQTIDQVWRRGMKLPLGRIAEVSGISMKLWAGPATSWKELGEAVKEQRPLVDFCRRAGAEVELDIGIDHNIRAATLGVRFPPRFLRTLATSGLDLVISTYLTDDE